MCGLLLVVCRSSVLFVCLALFVVCCLLLVVCCRVLFVLCCVMFVFVLIVVRWSSLVACRLLLLFGVFFR